MATFIFFYLFSLLPRDAMLARYLLSACVGLFVRPSVCHKPVLYQNDSTHRAGFRLGGFLPPIPRCAVRKFGYLQKFEYFPLELCPKLRTQKISPRRFVTAAAVDRLNRRTDGRTDTWPFYDACRILCEPCNNKVLER